MPDSTALWSVADVESFIHGYYDAWSGTDEDRIMSFYAEDVVLQIPGTLMEGKEQVRDQFVRPFITAFPGNRHFAPPLRKTAHISWAESRWLGDLDLRAGSRRGLPRWRGIGLVRGALHPGSVWDSCDR